MAWLKEYGVSVEARDDFWGYAALHWAVRMRKFDAMEWLLEQGADIEAGNPHGETPLFMAAMNGFIDCMDWLVRHGADINRRDGYGTTPMVTAVMRQNGAAARWLKEKGASIRVASEDGRTLFHYAADFTDFRDHSELGAPVRGNPMADRYFDILDWLKSEGLDVDVRDDDGYTPLHLAAANGDIVAMQWLKENGADLNLGDNDGQTPVLCAADISGIPGATVDEYLFAETGSPAPRAVAYIGPSVANMRAGLRWLEANGASATIVHPDGNTLMHAAARAGNLGGLNWLKWKGVDVNAKNMAGETPWDVAKDDATRKWLEDNGGHS